MLTGGIALRLVGGAGRRRLVSQCSKEGRQTGGQGPQSAPKTESEAFKVVRCFVASGTNSRLDKKKEKD